MSLNLSYVYVFLVLIRFGISYMQVVGSDKKWQLEQCFLFTVYIVILSRHILFLEFADLKMHERNDKQLRFSCFVPVIYSFKLHHRDGGFLNYFFFSFLFFSLKSRFEVWIKAYVWYNDGVEGINSEGVSCSWFIFSAFAVGAAIIKMAFRGMRKKKEGPHSHILNGYF